MGAAESSENQALKRELSVKQISQLKNANKIRSKRASMKRGRSNLHNDMTVTENRVFTLSELKKAEQDLTSRLTTLKDDIEKKKAQNNDLFIQEYKSITSGKTKLALASGLQVNKELNRYNNINAYDASRVTVTPNENNGNTDYINANYIHGFNSSNMYIAAQGPVPNAFNAFWQMIAEQNIEIIVMVTNEVEDGKLKCHRYWPDHMNTSIDFGDVNVSQSLDNPEILFESHIQRNFVVKYREQEWTVVQYAYTQWPDHGAPETTEEMLRFRALIKERSRHVEAPLLIHCSAGVGRTGTYIGLDRYLDSCANLKYQSIIEIVKDMRESRNYMVQAQAQYNYLHEACHDGLQILLEKIQKEIALAELPPEELAVVQAEEAALQREKDQQAEILAAKRAEYLRSPEYSRKMAADLRASEVLTKYAVDVSVAKGTPLDKRISSGKKSTEAWEARNQGPARIAVAEHIIGKTETIGDRLKSIQADAAVAWKERYSAAEKTWAVAHAGEGNEYDIFAEITPIESVIQSLAVAEEIWKSRGDGMRSAKADDPLIERLTERIKLLTHESTTADDRWRERGDGFVPSENPLMEDPDLTVFSGKVMARGSKVFEIAPLNTRLVELQSRTTEWESRVSEQKAHSEAQVKQNKEWKNALDTAASRRHEQEKAAAEKAAAEKAATAKADRAAALREREALREAAKKDARMAKIREMHGGTSKTAHSTALKKQETTKHQAAATVTEAKLKEESVTAAAKIKAEAATAKAMKFFNSSR